MGLFLQGFLSIFDPITFLFVTLAIIGGIIIGAIPGLTSSMGIILLLPMVYKLPPEISLLVMAGLYCGGMYGGSISAILINTPGAPAASATVLDGHPMTKKGQAGKALSTALIGSFFGGLFSTLCLALIAPQLAKVALKFQAAEYFSLSIFGLTIMAGSSTKNIVKGLISGFFGLLISTVGIDTIVGIERFTFGNPYIMGGFSMLPVLIGVFALSQFFEDAERKKGAEVEIVKQDLSNFMLNSKELRRILPAMLIGAIIGTAIGIIPGTGGAIACFLAYDIVKNLSKKKDQFGTGLIEGIAAPEAANNGTTGGALIPMLTLGIPGDVTTAIMLGGLLLIGVRPGPLLFVERPEVVYSLLSGMFVIQFMMLGLGLAAAKISPKILDIPPMLMMPIVAVFCVVGAYTLGNSLYDVMVAFAFGIIGYFMRKRGYPGAPMVLGVILGPMAEENLNRALVVSRNDWGVLITRPISATFLIISLLSIVWAFYSARKKAHARQA
ncbi:MAG: tripartite tricarboxylate transporter permease [Spirochaetia bacterium]|jgi:putative tricarboxylic transport membrane protein|nr:tripartite tricarboxylate transporter permease [Spirochaetia bacterium]